MKSKKFSLKDINDETADKILEKYPAEWNMDKVFNASYKKFLASEKNEDVNVLKNIAAADDELDLCSVENVPKKRRIAVFTFRKLATAAFAVMMIVMFRTLCVMPDKIHDSSDDIDKLPIITHERNDFSETDTSPVTSDVYEKSSPISTSAATASGDVPAETVTTKSVYDSEQDISTTEENTVADSPVTEAPAIHTEPATTRTTTSVTHAPEPTEPNTNSNPPLTNTGENKKTLTKAEFIDLVRTKDDFTWSDFEQYKSEDIGSGLYVLKYEIVDENGEYRGALYLSGSSMTEKPKNIYLEDTSGKEMDIYQFKEFIEKPFDWDEDPGYFQYTTYESGKWDTLQYITNRKETVTPLEHTFELDGFDFKVNREEEYEKDITIIKTETDQKYSLKIESYERFIVSLNPKIERIKTDLVINDRPAYFIRYADDEIKICNLYWDDGCHVCSLTSSIDNYDSMLLIAENLK